MEGFSEFWKPKFLQRKGVTQVANVFDVAAYILEKKRAMTTWKLQKLVYYSQAWSLVWDDRHLFDDSIEAWANGPVVRRLFDDHRGQFSISSIPLGNSNNLTNDEKETITSVLAYYGDRSSQYLSDLTHMEDPWKLARKGISASRRSNKIISLESMAEYYGSLQPEDE